LFEERIFYLGRFNTLPGKKLHESKDSLVMIVDDAESKQLVALKMMVQEEQLARETAMRKTEDSEGLAAHVLPILHSFTDKKALGFGGQYPYGHVLPAAEMDLNDFLQHNQVEGNTLYTLTCKISRQTVEHAQFLHKICSMIHGGVRKGGPKKSIALDQTGYGAIQRVHLGPLNRTFPARYFPGSALSVENHCFGPLGQSVSFRRRYPAKKKGAKPEPATGMAGGNAQGALGTAGAMG
jgi:hypothetical protein